jgi:Uma2 family endonuclease
MNTDEFWTFLETVDDHYYFELINHRVVGKSFFPIIYAITHSKIIGNLFEFVQEQKLGFNFGRLYYELSDKFVLVPDASFVSKSRLKFPLPERMTHAPDLAIEILFAEDTAQNIRAKIDAYLAHGTKLVWIVIPEDKEVEVWRAMPDGSLNKRTFGVTDTLSGEDVLPNFTLSISDIFDIEL